MLRLSAALLGLLFASPATAQYWATKEICDVKAPQIHASEFAPATEGDLHARAAEIPNSVGPFWKVVAPNGTVSHLWGTFHSNHPLILDLPGPVLDALHGSDLVATEIDGIHSSRRKLEIRQSGLEAWRPARSGFDFDTIDLPEDVIDWIKSRFAGLNYGRYALDHLTLAAVAETLLSDPCNDFAYGTFPTQDSRSQMLTAIEGIDYMPLEAFDRFAKDLKAPEHDLLATSMIAILGPAFNPKATPEARATLFELYLSGRIGVMMAWEESYLRSILGVCARVHLARADGYLLNQRNKEWVQTLGDTMLEKKMFIAAGSFHLPRSEGLVALLRAKGYTVSRIPLER
ncbi:TraB/GumN family protein [Planktotalea sp.]|uniref:TraB/GumN family protein n=1 Tax=Planktotalea sp. TaxID=2029877 RepID=UPI0025D41BBF|nr:TraB/GumN family protein [Planktotalea sp.]